MVMRRWPIAIPVAVFLLGSVAWGSAIRDEAKLFSPQVVEEARRHLDRIERATNIPVVIETIEHIPGYEDRGTTKDEKHEARRDAINRWAERRDSQIRDEGIYIAISKREAVISHPLIRKRLERALTEQKLEGIRRAFIDKFGHKDFDGGLKAGVMAIEDGLRGVRGERTTEAARAGAPVGVGPGAGRGAGGRGGGFLGTFLLIGMGILAVLIVLRILGGLFGRSGAGYPGPMGGMGGPRPGMGPGGPGYYGGPGYGGRGGGFFSGLLGGLGGALAGNWLYDQMSGRHGGMTSAGAGYPPGEAPGVTPDQGDDAIIGGQDDQGQASWDNAGADTGGGDWGGGGGDWGGGGGDWGGGGGDWGGGDGGGGGDW